MSCLVQRRLVPPATLSRTSASIPNLVGSEEFMSLVASGVDRSRAWLWLIVVGLVALSGSAMVVSVGVLLLVLAALVVPLFAITVYSAVWNTAPTVTAADRARVDKRLRARLSWDGSGVDVHGWENEGGAQA
jgi:hypothetical protein